ncbi:unnamed protein product [Durusdinium trenchii]|uniref:Uncharacterized protein n=2 Tax=Durusdinium trenchii TaxID=1381693 RepID=A0ABP0S7T2_9DINO
MVSLRLAAGCLAFRLADGFARNALLANQIMLFQHLCHFGTNTAQRAAKFLNAACAVTPLVVGAYQSRSGMKLSMLVLLGCVLEALCTATTAVVGASPDWALSWEPTIRPHESYAIVFVLTAYALGYGAVTSAMPVMTRRAAPEGSLCAGLMQAFVAVLSAGAIMGISAAALAQSYHEDHWALLSAVIALACGICFLPPIGGTPLPFARCILRLALRLGPEELALWEAREEATNRLLGTSTTPLGAASEQSLSQLMPLFWRLLLLVPFYGAAIQWTTSWYVQTAYLDRNVAGFKVPVCLLQAFERLMSLAALTLLRGTFVLKLKPSTRLSLGSFLAALSMFCSAGVEIWRRDWSQRLAGDPDISSLTVLWLLPQFALIAAAEAFVYPASAEFVSASTWHYGLGCLVQAAAVAMLGLVLGQLQDWIPESSPNDGHYDKFFACVGAACLIATVLFLAFPFSSSSMSALR